MLASPAMASAPREVFGDLATTAFVESSLLFRSLDPEARRDLLQLAQRTTWAAGEIVSGVDDEGFYLVLEGRAVVTVESLEVASLERGAFFGEGRVLGAGVPAALVARTEVAAVMFPASVVAALAERFPRVKKLLEAIHAAREKDAAARRAS
jgi:signal-transduction protein with cAMP-binding, CBS, and nucleotidyltransferase domain